jgi:hypothetical protein
MNLRTHLGLAPLLLALSAAASPEAPAGAPAGAAVPVAPAASAAPLAAAPAASAASATAPAPAAPPLPPSPPPPPPPAAFQGLPWGADEAQIAARFGTRLEPASCDAAARAQAQRLGELCESPTVPRYEVAGVPFVLKLHLDATDRRLVRVSLSHTAEHGRLDEPRWSDHHRVMRRLLSQRYGGPEYTDLQHEAGASTAVARWRTGPALIDLNSSFQPRSTGAPAREQILITYQSPFHGEASKL